MKTYILKADANRFQNLALVNEDDWECLLEFDGSPLAQTWRPLPVRLLYHNPKGQQLPRGDFPMFTLHIPVFNKKATEILANLLEGNGELLPLLSSSEEYYSFNVTRMLDILNEDQSEIVRFPSGGISDVKAYTFNAYNRELPAIFKLPQTKLMDVFVTDKFMEAIENAKLKGFTFIPVGEIAIVNNK